jgi:hypothetical protein
LFHREEFEGRTITSNVYPTHNSNALQWNTFGYLSLNHGTTFHPPCCQVNHISEINQFGRFSVQISAMRRFTRRQSWSSTDWFPETAIALELILE